MSRWLSDIYKLSVPIPVPDSFGIKETVALPQCFTDYEPRMKNALAGQVVTAWSSWKPEIAFFDKAAVEKSIAQGRLLHLRP